MIRSFRHKGLRRFFETGSTAGINVAFASKLRLQLTTLDAAVGPDQMKVASWDLHPLTGSLQGHWSVSVSGNWRLTFRFVGMDAEVVNLQDYH